jgi:hypothetical protein
MANGDSFEIIFITHPNIFFLFTSVFSPPSQKVENSESYALFDNNGKR